jgi:ribosomal RNA methyltransferase Nop2
MKKKAAKTLELEESEVLTAFDRRASRTQAAEARELEEARAEEEDAQVQEYEPYELPTPGEVQQERDGAPDLPSVRRRIQDVARVLSNFKRLRQPGRSRSEYMERLVGDLGVYYGCVDCCRLCVSQPAAVCAVLHKVPPTGFTHTSRPATTTSFWSWC